MNPVIIVELLKIIATVVIEIGRRSGMSQEELEAYAKNIDNLFMQLPSAGSLPDIK